MSTKQEIQGMENEVEAALKQQAAPDGSGNHPIPDGVIDLDRYPLPCA